MNSIMCRLRQAAPAALAFVAIWGSHSTASAVFVSSAADGYDLSANVTTTVAGVVGASVTIPPVNDVMSSNPPGINTTSTIASFNGGATGVLGVTTGVLVSAAQTLPNGQAVGAATVNDLALTVGPAVGLITPLTPISLTATTIQSAAFANGDIGSLMTSGTTSITNPVLTVLGIPIAISAAPAPNTDVSAQIAAAGLTGVSLILNEQIPSGNGTTTKGITVNAIDLRLTSTVAGLTTLNGQVIIGHSFATITAAGSVPEPSTFALMGIASATLGLGWVRARLFRSRSADQAA